MTLWTTSIHRHNPASIIFTTILLSIPQYGSSFAPNVKTEQASRASPLALGQYSAPSLRQHDVLTCAAAAQDGVHESIEDFEADYEVPLSDGVIEGVQVPSVNEDSLRRRKSSAPTDTRSNKNSLKSAPEFYGLAHKSINNPACAEKAEELLHKLIQNSESSPTEISPSVRSFSSVILAYTNAGQPKKAEEVLKTMIQYSRTQSHRTDDDELKCKPNTIIFTTVINAWSKSEKRGAAERADKILAWMEQMSEAGFDNVAPNSITYATVIHAWATSGGEKAAMRSEELLERMEQLRSQGVSDVKPDRVAFTSVICAWARSNVPHAIDRCEYILDRMIELSNEGNEDVRPNQKSFNSVMSAYVKNNVPNCAASAERLLNRMEMIGASDDEAKPDTVSFNICINAWSRSDDEAAAQYAESLLDRMETRYDGGDLRVKPNDRSYNSVISAWVRSHRQSSLENASAVLSRMIEASKKGNKDAMPDVISFSALMDAWAKSKEPGKAKKAQDILHQMIDQSKGGNKNLKPNTISYNTVINACAFSRDSSEEEKEEALLIAVATFNELRTSEFCQPDAISYGMVLKAFNNLANKNEKRNNMSERLFKQCCKDGLVGDLFLNEIKRALPGDTLRALLKEGSASWDRGNFKLPKSWTRNVRDKRSKQAKWKKRKSENASENAKPDQMGARKNVPQISIVVGGTKGSDLLGTSF